MKVILFWHFIVLFDETLLHVAMLEYGSSIHCELKGQARFLKKIHHALHKIE